MGRSLYRRHSRWLFSTLFLISRWSLLATTHCYGFWRNGVLYGRDPRVFRQQNLAVLDDEHLDTGQASYFDDFIRHVLCAKKLGFVEGTIARLQGEVMVVFAHEALLMQTIVDQQFAYAKEIENVDYIAQGSGQFFRLVIMEALDGFRFFF